MEYCVRAFLRVIDRIFRCRNANGWGLLLIIVGGGAAIAVGTALMSGFFVSGVWLVVGGVRAIARSLM